MSSHDRSVRLPVEIRSNDAGGPANFELLGFAFGPPDPRDPKPRDARLPAGWQLGIDRVKV